MILENEILQAANLTEQELKIEIALLLFQQSRLSFGQARKLVGLEYFEFEKLLSERKIPSVYTVEDLHSDLKTLQELKDKRDRS